MRVLQFAPRACWPLDTGAKLRNFHLARVLAHQTHFSLLAFKDHGERLDQPLTALEDLYEKVTMVERDAAYTFAKIVRGGLGPTPLPVLNYTTDRMKQTLERSLTEREFDIVQVESVHLMAYLPIIRATPNRPLAVCDWHNIESDLMLRYSERESSPARRIYARRTARLMSEFEHRANIDKAGKRVEMQCRCARDMAAIAQYLLIDLSQQKLQCSLDLTFRSKSTGGTVNRAAYCFKAAHA